MHATVKIVFRQGYTFVSGNCWEIRVRKLKTSTELVHKTDTKTDTKLAQNRHKTGKIVFARACLQFHLGKLLEN